MIPLQKSSNYKLNFMALPEFNSRLCRKLGLM